MELTGVNALRRRWVLAGSALVTAVGIPSRVLAHGDSPHLEVWLSPDCGCCNQWVSHLDRDGFTVQVFEVGDPTVYRKRLGMPAQLGACHTARSEGYVIEGHVPAREIRRLLRERPKALGLAVPDMPSGSPGLESGSEKDPYAVLLVEKDGRTSVYQSYR